MREITDYRRRELLKYFGILGASVATSGVLKNVGFNPLETTAAEAAPQTSVKPKITKSEVEELLDRVMKAVLKIDNNLELKEKIREPWYRLTELHGYQIVDG